MSAPAITVERKTPVGEVARLMSQSKLSGLPVIDEADKVVGIVTDGDLCHWAELGTERRPKGLLDTLFLSRPDAKDYVEGWGHTAEDVMTRKVYFRPARHTLEQDRRPLRDPWNSPRSGY